ncbi:hypothetical protein [Aquabacterium humicola]|uniref:hypothetical protein n=1 Tax=Aquabacterium humicola TaxID=3237377 RepID=UPI002543A5F8|nr:hypothetical protein [Rubrivivax pictus]
MFTATPRPATNCVSVLVVDELIWYADALIKAHWAVDQIIASVATAVEPKSIPNMMSPRVVG